LVIKANKNYAMMQNVTTDISSGFRRGASRLRPLPLWATNWRRIDAVTHGRYSWYV